MGKDITKTEPVKLTRVREEQSLPTSPLRSMSSENLERIFDKLCRARDNSAYYYAVHTERSSRLADAARERALKDACAKAEIAAHERRAELDKLDARAVRKCTAEELNNTPEFSFLEGKNDLEKW